jgi:hypothetical protein
MRRGVTDDLARLLVSSPYTYSGEGKKFEEINTDPWFYVEGKSIGEQLASIAHDEPAVPI